MEEVPFYCTSLAVPVTPQQTRGVIRYFADLLLRWRTMDSKIKAPCDDTRTSAIKKKGLSVKPGVDESKVYMLRLLLRILLF